MPLQKYKHLFFDLDHTLWDFDTNAKETLLELYEVYQLQQIGIPPAPVFIDYYTRNNHALWAQYHRGEISKEELRATRFRKTFLDLGLSPDKLPLQFEEDYVNLCPTKKNLFPQTLEVLAYLLPKYTLHIITNGFYESSMLKINNTGLSPYFASITCSEVLGHNKPDILIFKHALQAAGAIKEESMMIGDSLEADIAGAIRFGMDCIYFNPYKQKHTFKVTYEIEELASLKEIL